ncbi:MAG: RNA ligase family protein, partial [Candidatus Kapaibacteriota bacterium]
KTLLNGKVVVEEKMDGKPVLMVGEKYSLFCEDLKQKHSISYVIPARYVIFDILDKENNSLLSAKNKIEIYKEIKQMEYFQKTPFLLYPNDTPIYPDSLFLIPILEYGHFKLEELPSLIRYSYYTKEPNSYMEGIVVKTASSSLITNTNRSGKLVREEFTNQITVHYLRKKAEYNIINPNMKEYDSLSKISISMLP